MSIYRVTSEDGTKTRDIVADRHFVEAHFPGRFELVSDAPPEVISLVVSNRALINRFTEDEWAGLDIASLDKPADGDAARKARAKLRRFLLKVTTSPSINLLSQEWINNLLAIEAAGLIAAGRAAQIAGTPASPEEAP